MMKKDIAGIVVDMIVETGKLDEAIEKAKELCEILNKINETGLVIMKSEDVK